MIENKGLLLDIISSLTFTSLSYNKRYKTYVFIKFITIYNLSHN